MKSETNLIQFPEIMIEGASTSREYAYQRLRHALMVGAIAPGKAITIQDLADLLGVSATPVREALRQLGSENALVTLKNRRIKVPEMTPDRFDELISLRCSLETYAARRALPYINQVLIDSVERVDFELDNAMEANDWATMVMLNQRFHSMIYRANPQPAVMPMIESLWLQLGPFMGIAVRHLKQINLDDHHKDIIEGLRNRDEEVVVKSLEADIRDGFSSIQIEGFEILGQEA